MGGIFMTALFIFIGLAAGIAAGLFGIGGGVIVVPALAYLAGFSQVKAVGTSLAALLLPVGLLAVIEYYRHGHVDLKAGVLFAAGLVLGAWLGAWGAQRMGEAWLKVSFGVFIILVGVWIVVSTLKGLPIKEL
jgi:uncharacterized membrane protein YfcA